MNKKNFLIPILILAFLIIVNALQFSDVTSGDFNNGSYNNTIHNGTSVVLSGNNLSGNYTSRVFDAGSIAQWSSLLPNVNLTKKDHLFVVDGAGAIFKSINSGVNWSLVNSSYGRTSDTNDLITDINRNLYIIATVNKEIWKSTNSGVSWTKVNDTFSALPLLFGTNDNQNNLYVAAGSSQGRVFKSSNSGVTWTNVNDSYDGGTAATKSITKNSSNALFVVDGNPTIYRSINSGTSWTNINSSYGGAGGGTRKIFADPSDKLYIITQTGREIWKSSNNGVSWTKVNDTFSSGDLFSAAVDSNGSIYTIAGSAGLVYKSTNYGVTWTQVNSSYHSSPSETKGFVSVTYSNNITFQVRNCSSSCSAETFVGPDGTSSTYFTNLSNSLNLTGRYFQYKAYFSSQEAGFTPNLFNVTINYTLLDNIPPSISFVSPLNQTYINNSVLVNISSSDNIGVSSVWFYNGTGNETYSSPVFRTFNQGSNSLIAYANDSVGNFNSTQILFTVDSILPSINVISPQNTTYGSSTILLNYTASDNIAISNCKYSIDGSTNITLPGCSTATISGLIDGTHTLILYANDTSNNLNYSTITFSTDSSPPQSSNAQASTPSSYSDSQLSFFNITWTDASNINSVLFESNFSGSARNYSMYAIGGGVYVFNYSLPAGTFYWKSYANDSLGNVDVSSTQVFSIEKANNPVSLFLNNNLNQNLTITYGTSTNATGNVSAGTISLFRDGLSVSNPDIAALAANTAGYKYTLNTTGDQNHSANSTTSYLFIQKGSSSINLFLNNNENDLSVNYKTQTNVTAVGNNGTAILYRDGLSVSNPDIAALAAGVYNYTSIIADNNNVTGSTKTSFLTVNKIAPNINLLINGQASDTTINYGSSSNVTGNENNTGDSDLVYELYKSNNLVNTGSPISDIFILGAGTYNYTYNTTGGQNYTSNTITRILNITKATPTLNLLIDGEDSDIAVLVNVGTNITASAAIPSSGLVSLYEDDNFIDSGVNIIKVKNYTSLGSRVWKVNITESENYTSAEKVHTITVIDSNYPQYSFLRESPSDPASYLSSNNYQFNSTWTDNVGISNVVLEFNGINYTLSNGEINNTGSVYYKNLNSLAAGTYNYRWYANDSSNNLVATPLQSYTINKAITALFLTMSPNNVINYGTSTTISCSANNPESIPALTKNSVSVSVPEVGILGAGTYNYACTSASTENYTSSSTTSILSVNKAQPSIILDLNGQDSDININPGSTINISAFLLAPSSESLDLTENNVEINYGLSPLTNFTLYNVEGTFIINASYLGNENYTSGSKDHTITVAEEQHTGSGGGGGGRSSGGGSFVSNQIKTESQSIKIEFLNLDEVLISPGESKTIQLSFKNIGNTFLNKCKLIGTDNWFNSAETKNVNVGEIADFILKINAPLAATQKDSPRIKISCIEKEIDIPLKVIILKSGLHIEIKAMNLISNDNLEVNYSLIGSSEFSKEIIFYVVDSEGKTISEKRENVKITQIETEKTTLLNVKDASKGILKISIVNADDKNTIVEEFFAYDSGKTITGFAFLDKVNKPLAYSVVILLVFGILAFYVIRRIIKIRKWQGY